MKLAERHIIKKGHRYWSECDNLAWKSKNLYNSANYLIRQSFIYGHGYINYNQMAYMMKTTEQYKELPAKVSQQVLKGLDKNWISFFEANKEYKENPNNWVLESNWNEKTRQRELSLEPIWSFDYLDKYVFSHYDKVFLMSGTILDKSLFCQLNGLDSDNSVYYSEELNN